MKRVLLSLLICAVFQNCHSQPENARGEFANQPNGLMYSDADMKVLRYIVDSLNIRFKTCDLSRKFYSQPQTRALSIRFYSDSNDLKAIIKDMEAGIAYADLQNKYARYIDRPDSSVLIIKTGNDGFLSGTPGSGYGGISLSDKKNFNGEKLKNKWTYTYDPKDKYSTGYALDCFFFPDEFNSTVIPGEYAALIQYVDCMIDTSASIYLPDKKENRSGRKQEVYVVINDYLNAAMKLKRKKKDAWEYDWLTDEKLAYAKTSLAGDQTFRDLVTQAAAEGTENGNSNDELEELIAFFVSKEEALRLKRSRRVVGGCSMDQSPRIHARNIAILAAETHRWDVFLRAHLDIMNDRFERNSDGSYAWGNRKTYLKELEELNLNIVDLMLGLSLRAENVASNHYYGTIWRMGWALTESREKDLFEQKAMTMMKDERLDEFNRGLIFLLYKIYISYLDENEAAQKKDELLKNISAFPVFIRHSIKELEQADNKKR